MAKIELKAVRKIFELDGNFEGDRSCDRGWRVHRADRPLRMRQVDIAARHCGSRAADIRRSSYRGRVRRRGSSQRPQSRDGVPVLRAVSAPHRIRQYCRAAADATPFRAGAHAPARPAAARTRPHRTRDPRGGRTGCRPARTFKSAQAQAGTIVGRPAAARGGRTRHRASAARVSVRRAAVQPGRQAAGAYAHRTRPATSPAESHLCLRDP